MRIPIPHFLLLSEAQVLRDDEGEGVEEGIEDRGTENGATENGGRWRIVLEATDGSTVLEAEDCEAETDQERLELLSVVRGLEALDEPARVTLVTSSRYVSHGLRFGLAEWREAEWQWERFGELVPIKNQDLWRRVDQALRYHSVDCRTWRIDRSHTAPGVGAARLGRRTGPHLAGSLAEETGREELETASALAHVGLRIADTPRRERRVALYRRRGRGRWRRWTRWVQECWRWLAGPALSAS
ncbi:MAG: RNase H family protein [Pirellulales bacterium]